MTTASNAETTTASARFLDVPFRKVLRFESEGTSKPKRRSSALPWCNSEIAAPIFDARRSCLSVTRPLVAGHPFVPEGGDASTCVVVVRPGWDRPHALHTRWFGLKVPRIRDALFPPKFLLPRKTYDPALRRLTAPQIGPRRAAVVKCCPYGVRRSGDEKHDIPFRAFAANSAPYPFGSMAKS